MVAILCCIYIIQFLWTFFISNSNFTFCVFLGKVSIGINSRYFEEKTNSPADLEATKRAWTFAVSF